MFSKYILPTNWVSLSSVYLNDSSVSFYNAYLPTAGNLSVYYSSALDNINDFSNNNYSHFILAGKRKLNNLIERKIKKNSLNSSTCVIGSNLDSGIVSDNTTFLRYNENTLVPTANNVIELDINNFFEIVFLNDQELIIKKRIDDYFIYLGLNDYTLTFTYLKSFIEIEKNTYEGEKYKFYYVLDNDKIILYKKIQSKKYFLCINKENVLSLESDLDELNSIAKLNYIRVGDLKGLDFRLDSVFYDTDISNNNNLSISKSKSNYSIDSNFLSHYQYNTVKNEIQLNFLTLKNHLNINDEYSLLKNRDVFRDYTTIFTGGGEEKGNENITLNYKSEYFTLNLEPDKTTWFHLPYDFSQSPVKINNANFVLNGSIGGTSPIFSDKIWKRLANYTFTSNQATPTEGEINGRWLCSWLSGGNGNFVWMDRFYNSDIFSPYEALKYSYNVEYTPEFKNTREPGITDQISTLTLEPGVWYAYSHMGKRTAMQILSGIGYLYKDKFDSYINSKKIDLLPDIDYEGSDIYNFNGDNIGTFLPPIDIQYNNFSISFFASRNQWNKNNMYSIIGNYVDDGLSIVNNNRFNPISFYYNGTKCYFLNDSYEVILFIDLSVYLLGNSFSISGIIRKDINENFYLVTSNYYILEFNAAGTLIDKVYFKNIVAGNPEILSVSNNDRVGVIKTDEIAFYQIDLNTNIIKKLNQITFSTNNTYKNSVVLDNYDRVYDINGISPIKKTTNIYYKNKDSDKIKVIDLGSLSNELTYLSPGSGTIMSFNFGYDDYTYLLYKDFILVYDEKGDFYKVENIDTNIKNITACNLFFNDFCNENYSTSVHFIDDSDNNYLYNMNSKTTVKIDENYNSIYNKLSAGNIPFNNYDASNYNYIQNTVDSVFPLPSYCFKIKLYNQLNPEDIKLLKIIVLGEILDTGEHHFCLTLDTLEGYFNLYINGKLYSSKSFTAKKYSLSNIFSNSYCVGSVPYLNNILFGDFYKGGKSFLANDLKIEKFKFYSNVLNEEEVKLLYFEKKPPKTIRVNIKTGERNFLDTITRTFKHKLQGSKTNLINLYINNSLIIDQSIQNTYNSIIISELTPHLPAGVKINSINWLNTIDSSDSMVIGNYSIKNTLTDTQDIS